MKKILHLPSLQTGLPRGEGIDEQCLPKGYRSPQILLPRKSITINV